MTRDELKDILLANHALRAGDHVLDYVHRRVLGGVMGEIPVMGADARTGVPLAVTLSGAELMGQAGAVG